MSFLELLDKKVNKLIFCNNMYYNLLSLYNIIKIINDKRIIVNDNIILPFYISNDKIYEIYDYELNIVVKGINTDDFILKKTGARRIKNVKIDLIEKINICYMNLNSPYIDNIKLLKYIEYVLNSEELHHRIYSIFNEYESQNLYFEIY